MYGPILNLMKLADSALVSLKYIPGQCILERNCATTITNMIP